MVFPGVGVGMLVTILEVEVKKKVYFMKYFKKKIHKINSFLLENENCFVKNCHSLCSKLAVSAEINTTFFTKKKLSFLLFF